MPKTAEELEAEVTALQAENAAAKARISELNSESKGHRLNADNARKDAERAAADLKAAQDDLAKARNLGTEAEAKAAEKVKEAEAKAAETAKAADTKAAETMTKAQERVVNADLKIAAKDAGAHDAADVLALLDRSKIKLSADGEIENAPDLIADLKKTKPHLFGATTTTSNPNKPPPKYPPGAKSAKDMTDEEFDAAVRAKAWRK